MKRKLFGLVAGCLLAPAVLCAAAFEGRVTFKMSGGRGQSQEMTYALKDAKIRMELPGERGASMVSIVDPAKREMVLLMPEQRRYMTMPMPDATEAAETKKSESVTLQKTGETERILGYTAEKYIATDANTKTEMWLAEGIGTFVGPGSASAMGGMGGGGRRGGVGNASQEWERLLAGKDLFPLRIVVRDKSSKEVSRLEATRVDRQALPDALFTPPADFEKFDMGAMMKGMGGGLPGIPRSQR